MKHLERSEERQREFRPTAGGETADGSGERAREMEWALECASRILKAKKTISDRHVGALMAAERKMALVERQLHEKGEALRKVLESQVVVEPMPARGRPAAISGITVIVPVKDGGETFANLLRAIRSQKKVSGVEILVLDSESTDGSAAVAESFGCRVITIPRKEFNHGGTRHFGAGQARGEYLVFTVQDAVPTGNYWLYGMASPFFSAPELGVVTCRQFVRPEADLISLWTNDATNAMIGYDGDSVYGLSPAFDMANWKHLDPLTKRRVSFVDNVSSCIPKSVYDEVPFRPLINAEDMDLGVRMLEKGKKLGFLASAGVYHWHERGPDYDLKRHYIGTKANVYIMGNELPRFFEVQDIGWRVFAANVSDLLDLVTLSAPDHRAVEAGPVKAAAEFIASFRRWFEAPPEKVSSALGKAADGCAERLEGVCPGLFAGAAPAPAERHRFHQNFLVPPFLKVFESFTGFLALRRLSYKGGRKEFDLCVRKILSSVVGEAAGAYYLESETSKTLTPDLKRMDRLLARGVCYF